ncbi:MAG: XdhC family protein [Gammaproteobacteria bacterium]|nr:XdhC family protein [Gammaproteobacteria bacterium]
MSASVTALLPLYLRERRAGRALVLGLLLHTQGSTYQKPGALMLFAAEGEYAGLFSGGCLEGDLREHAEAVRRSGEPRTVRYDLRDPDDLIWGLGLGCEGLMQILLLRVGPENAWEPLHCLAQAHQARTGAAVGVVYASASASTPTGSLLLPAACGAGLRGEALQRHLQAAQGSAQTQLVRESAADGSYELCILPLALPPRVLLLGAGPDALPVVELAARLGWEVTLADHRAAYAVPSRFPGAHTLLLPPGTELERILPLEDFAAAVVMSHHLAADAAYLRALAGTRIPYVGLLGPPARRDKLLAELGPDAQALRGRLHAPVGLPLGGRSPEAIALSIIAELQAFLCHRSGIGYARAPPATVQR